MGSRLGYFADILVGSICCRVEDLKGSPGKKAIYIKTLSVLKPYQRHKMASQLLEWALDKAEREPGNENIEEMFLNVQTSNKGAQEFYKSHGFEIAEEIKGYYLPLDPPDCYVLRKKLTRA